MDESQVRKFEEDGYVVIENYYSTKLCDQLRQECARIVEEADSSKQLTIFSSVTNEQSGEDYFITSGDKIRFFWEEGAMNDKGELVCGKELAINKIGHALHILNPVFRSATYTDRLSKILRQLQFVRPVVPQSMYIFKQPNFGGEVTKHMDATFLDSSPLHLLGLWIALEDATEENGCLWFVPGSHKNEVDTRRMIRNPNGAVPRCIFTGEHLQLDNSKYIPVPVKRGSLVLIDGKVQHKSSKNTSLKSRNAYTFHVTESHQSDWSEKNWLQPPDNSSFPLVYDDA